MYLLQDTMDQTNHLLSTEDNMQLKLSLNSEQLLSNEDSKLGWAIIHHRQYYDF